MTHYVSQFAVLIPKHFTRRGLTIEFIFGFMDIHIKFRIINDGFRKGLCLFALFPRHILWKKALAVSCSLFSRIRLR